MPITVRTCECFLDVGSYTQINHLGYNKFHKMCLGARTKNRTFIIRRNYVYIVCCNNHLRDCRTEGVKNLTERLKDHFLFCFDDHDVDNVCCSQRNDDFSEVEYYCFSCQFTVLFEFSKKLHIFFPLLILVENGNEILCFWLSF